VRDVNYADVLTMYHYLIGTRLANSRMDSEKFDRCSTKLHEWESVQLAKDYAEVKA
jgi:hypothetical protein